MNNVEEYTCLPGRQVMSEEECQKTATYLGKTWYGAGTWGDHITGCFEGHGGKFNRGTGNGNMHFNLGGSYGTRQRGYAACGRRKVSAGFWLNAVEEYGCTTGKQVMSEAECKKAATSPGKRWYGGGSWGDHITGCLEGHSGKFNRGTGNGNMHFNRGGSNKKNQRGYAVCEGYEVEPDFQMNIIEERNCLIGKEVMSEKECQEAATSLGKRWYGGGTWGDHIPGCLEGHGATMNGGTGNGNMHFNNGGSYGKKQRGYAVCGRRKSTRTFCILSICQHQQFIKF